LPNYNEKADYSYLKILYEDNHLIVVYKPCGLLVQGDYSGDITLIDIVRKYLANKYNKKGNVYLGLIHRLDKPASGVVIFAKTSKGASRLSKQFREHKINKIYYAIVEGENKDKSEQHLKSYIVRGGSKSIVIETKRKDAQYSELLYKPIHTHNNLTLLRVKLITGRKHQIRTQLSTEGFPILGDKKYSAKRPFECDSYYSKERGCIALLCAELSFTHPITKDNITIKVDLPNGWKTLLDILSGIKSEF
jgi:23S rRNA pseudouridine1911/1915/1917 synthase